MPWGSATTAILAMPMSIGPAILLPPSSASVGEARVDVRDREVDEPMRRRWWRQFGDRAVAAFAVGDHEVAHRHALHRRELPAEELAVERGRAIDIGRGELVPRERPRRVDELCAIVLMRLPDREVRALWIPDRCHPPGIEDVERRCVERGAELGGAGRDGVGVGDRHVGVPGRRRAGISLGLRLRADRADLLAIDEHHRVDDPVADRPILGLPAEQRRIERLRAVLVGRRQIDPAEGSRRVGGPLTHRRRQ